MINDPGNGTTLNLPYKSPFHWEAVLDYFHGRAIPGVEVIHNSAYSRAVEIDGHISFIRIKPSHRESHLAVTFYELPNQQLSSAEVRVRDMFDLDAEPLSISSHLSKDPYLASIISRYPGLRLLGCWDAFELSVRAVIGQQVTLKAASTILGRLTHRFGQPISKPPIPWITHVFPGADVLAQTRITGLGIPGKRAEALKHLAEKVRSRCILFDGSMDVDHVVHRLREIPGIGPWTTDYISMRGMRDPDAFPQTDLVIKKILERLKNNENPGTDINRRINSWRPWRAYAAMYLWKAYSVDLSPGADNKNKQEE